MDYLNAETIVTSSGTAGYQVRAVIGETSEKVESLNGNHWTVEGVFYE